MFTIRVAVASFPASSDTVYTTSYSPTVEVSTSPETSIASDTSPSTLSSAVAPGSSYVEPTSNSIGLSPFKEITGATVSSGSGSSPLPSASTTFTTLVAVPSFPAASDTTYLILYSPIVQVSTSPVTSISSDTSPSTLSSAVAPGSSYVEPTSNSIGLSPFKEITGATVSSGSGSSPLPSASTTFTTLVAVASFPAASDTT